MVSAFRLLIDETMMHHIQRSTKAEVRLADSDGGDQVEHARGVIPNNLSFLSPLTQHPPGHSDFWIAHCMPQSVSVFHVVSLNVRSIKFSGRFKFRDFCFCRLKPSEGDE